MGGKLSPIGERTGESFSLSLARSLAMACFHAHPSAQVNRASMKHYHRTDCVENPATLSDQTVSRFYPQQNTFSTQDHERTKAKDFMRRDRNSWFPLFLHVCPRHTLYVNIHAHKIIIYSIKKHNFSSQLTLAVCLYNVKLTQY